MSVRRLYRSKKDRMILGVCGGIAEYLHIDPSIVRLLWILSGCLFGSGVVAYLTYAMIVPVKKDDR